MPCDVIVDLEDLMDCLFCGSAARVISECDRQFVRDDVCGEYRISGSAEATLISFRDWHIHNSMQNELRVFAIHSDPQNVIDSDDLWKAGLVPSYDGPGNLKDWNERRRTLGLPSISNPD